MISIFNVNVRKNLPTISYLIRLYWYTRFNSTENLALHYIGFTEEFCLFVSTSFVFDAVIFLVVRVVCVLNIFLRKFSIKVTNYLSAISVFPVPVKNNCNYQLNSRYQWISRSAKCDSIIIIIKRLQQVVDVEEAYIQLNVDTFFRSNTIAIDEIRKVCFIHWIQ